MLLDCFGKDVEPYQEIPLIEENFGAPVSP
jgi:hypothetical protein